MDSTSVTTTDLSNVTSSLPYIYQLGVGTFDVILTCIIFVGFIGNITFIWTVVRMPSLHRSTYIYLTSLACVDLSTLIGVFCLANYDKIIPLIRLENLILLNKVSQIVSWFSFAWSLCLVTLE